MFKIKNKSFRLLDPLINDYLCTFGYIVLYTHIHRSSYLYTLMRTSEKAMASHSSTLAWKIPWTEEAWWAAVHGVTKSRTWLSDFTFTFHFHALEKEMATHSIVLAWRVPGMGSQWAAIYGVAQSQTRLKRHSSSSNENIGIILSYNLIFILDNIRWPSFYISTHSSINFLLVMKYSIKMMYHILWIRPLVWIAKLFLVFPLINDTAMVPLLHTFLCALSVCL